MYDTARLSRWLLLILLLPFLQCKPPQKTFMAPPFDLQGHRGCRGLMPENTISAMIKALQLGVNTLEMDAVISKDRQVVISHDPFFNHDISTTPAGNAILQKDETQYNLYQMNYTDIRQWDVGTRPYPRFPRQEKIPAIKPLLSKLIDTVEQYIREHGLRPVQYNIETKSLPATDNIFHPEPEDFTELLMEVIKQKKIEQRTIIQSFDVRTLQVMHKKYPTIRTALLVEGFNKRNITENLEYLGFTPAIYSPEYSLVTPELIAYCHDKGIKVIPWTVNDVKGMDRLRELKVDGLITDYPDLFTR
jgi:glycerophosphoryl diester phosphodiesterase